MLTKPVLLALLAACGVSSSATTESPSEQPIAPPTKPPEPEGQHFCCAEVDEKTFSGDGCVLISEQQVALCNNLLYCDKKYVKQDGKVTCE
jgi:hypothetical protein